MDKLEAVQACLVVIEDVMVSEFRAYQSLIKLTKEERRVLSSADLNALANVVTQKEALVTELARLEEARCSAIEQWSEHHEGLARSRALAPAQSLTLGEILPHLETTTAGRLKRLREGILALVNQLSDLTQGNRALVTLALERLEAVRHFLISLSQPAAYYQPAGAPVTARADTVLAVEHWA
jgi:flagellar biosynthesis/type III secretory pathway chaperone